VGKRGAKGDRGGKKKEEEALTAKCNEKKKKTFSYHWWYSSHGGTRERVYRNDEQPTPLIDPPSSRLYEGKNKKAKGTK
jgi:hypothetical protein